MPAYPCGHDCCALSHDLLELGRLLGALLRVQGDLLGELSRVGRRDRRVRRRHREGSTRRFPDLKGGHEFK